MMHPLSCCVLFALLSASAFGQQFFESRFWKLAPSSPVEFLEDADGNLSAVPKHGQQISGFQYGCVSQDRDKLVVTRPLHTMNTAIPKEQIVLTRKQLEQFAFTDCGEKGLLSIVRVRFSDGAEWRLKPLPKGKARRTQ